MEEDALLGHQPHRPGEHELLDIAARLCHPLRRVGKPTDVANLVVFLASDAGSFITGHNISVNGGFVTQ